MIALKNVQILLDKNFTVWCRECGYEDRDKAWLNRPTATVYNNRLVVVPWYIAQDEKLVKATSSWNRIHLCYLTEDLTKEKVKWLIKDKVFGILWTRARVINWN